MKRWLLLTVAAALVAVAVAGCGGSSGNAGSTTAKGGKGGKASKGGKLKAPPVTDAAAFRDRLLKMARKRASDQPGGNATYGVSEAWHKKFPKLQFVASTEAADPKTVSGYQFTARNAKEPASKDNPLVLAFAVADTRSSCAGGTIEGYPKPDKTMAIDMAGATACTGAAVAAKTG